VILECHLLDLHPMDWLSCIHPPRVTRQPTKDSTKAKCTQSAFTGREIVASSVAHHDVKDPDEPADQHRQTQG